jgi:tetratricopeptide (TPR) repeat protein
VVAIKDQLLGLIKTSREKEAKDLVPHVDDSPPSSPARWTAKDNLAHLTAWRLVAAAELDAGRTGGPGPVVSEDDDVENAKIYARTHHELARSIVEAGTSSWDLLAAAVEAGSDEDLLKPRTRQPGQALWQAVPNNTYFHLAEHLGDWHTDRGDEAAAEEAARWGHDLAVSSFPEDRVRADYNLGCFYAKRSRAQEAMPYLRSGLELDPDLREWARKDTDLDPIRSAPELSRLLG